MRQVWGDSIRRRSVRAIRAASGHASSIAATVCPVPGTVRHRARGRRAARGRSGARRAARRGCGTTRPGRPSVGVAEQEQVGVERARAPPRRVRVASRRALGGVEPVEERLRAESRLEAQDGVEVVWLRRLPRQDVRLGLIHRARGGDAHTRATDVVDGSAERREAVADVRPEADEGGRLRSTPGFSAARSRPAPANSPPAGGRLPCNWGGGSAMRGAHDGPSASDTSARSHGPPTGGFGLRTVTSTRSSAG